MMKRNGPGKLFLSIDDFVRLLRQFAYEVPRYPGIAIRHPSCRLLTAVRRRQYEVSPTSRPRRTSIHLRAQ